MNVKTTEIGTMTTCQKSLLSVTILTAHAYLLLAILTQIFRNHLPLGEFYMTFAMIFLSRLLTRIIFLQRLIRM